MMAMGRPPKEINCKDFENLCALQCTLEEVCAWFDITDKPLNSWCKSTYGKTFSEVFAEKRGLGAISLRRNQFNLSKSSAAMAIFLGKNLLGQSDVVDLHANDGGFMESFVKYLTGAKNANNETTDVSGD